MGHTPVSPSRLERQARRAEERRQEKLALKRRAVRRRRARIAAVVSATVLVVGGGTTLAVVQVRAAHARAALAGPNNMLADGVHLTGDGTTITALKTSANDADHPPVATPVDRSGGLLEVVWHVDYTDPDAATFWKTNEKTVRTMLTAGQLTFELHPIGTDDAAVAAGDALACVADLDQDKALDVHGALLAAQKTLTDATPADLVEIVRHAGVDSPKVEDCIAHRSFDGWVRAATQRAAKGEPYAAIGPVTGTTLTVSDQRYTGSVSDADAFGSFLMQVALSQPSAAGLTGGDGATATPTAAPTPTPTPTNATPE